MGIFEAAEAVADPKAWYAMSRLADKVYGSSLMGGVAEGKPGKRPGPLQLSGELGKIANTMVSPERRMVIGNSPKRVIAPASGERNVKRHTMKGNMSGFTPSTVVTYPSVTLQMPLVKKSLRSSWKQFQDYFSGKKTLINTFSFLMTSDKGKRGVLAIPLRTDPVIYGRLPNMVNTGGANDVDDFGYYGSKRQRVHANAGLHVVGDLLRNGLHGDSWDGGNVDSASTICEPDTNTTPGCVNGVFTTGAGIGSTSNMLVPGMSLLHLESASWDLNTFKACTDQRIESSKSTATNTFDPPTPFLRPMLAYGNPDQVLHTVATTGTAKQQKYPNNYVSRVNNGPRQQLFDPTTGNHVTLETDKSSGPVVNRPEQYEVQCGSGYIELDIKNLSSHGATIELCAVKPKNSAFSQCESGETRYPNMAENFWDYIRNTNGQLYKKSVMESRSKLLTTSKPDSTTLSLNPKDHPVLDDIISNPYVNFLPSSAFTGRTFIGTQANGARLGVTQDSPQPPRAIVTNPVIADIGGTAQFAQQGGSNVNIPIFSGDHHIESYYSVVARAFAVVPAEGKRKIRVPLPKMRYNPSEDGRFSKFKDGKGHVNNSSMKLTPMNPESIMLCLSVNGVRSDFFKDPEGTGTNAGQFVGQDFTAGQIYVDAVYKETVYPACLQPMDHGVSFNFGAPSSSNMPTGGDTFVAGQTLAETKIVPVKQTS